MRTKKPTYNDLLRQNMELKASMPGTYARARKDVTKASVNFMMASGVLIQITAIGGKPLIEPVLIVDGLSDDTVAALQKDITRSLETVCMVGK